MTQAIPKLLTFDEFIAWYPDTGNHYELHQGVIVEMPKPTGTHSEVAGFISGKLFTEIERLQLPYFIPKDCVIKPATESGYEPDVIVLDRLNVTNNESRWKKESIISQGASVRLVVEVVSTNWQDDYALKFDDYELLGIQEYWIADYLGLGGRKFIGNPKQPTISVCYFQNGEYQITQFTRGSNIYSPTFPELNLSADRIFAFGEML